MAMRLAFFRLRGKRESSSAFDGFLSALSYLYGYRCRSFSGTLLRPDAHSDTQGVPEAEGHRRYDSGTAFRKPWCNSGAQGA
jgi:hypothetical protein